MARTKRPIEPPFAALILFASWPVIIFLYAVSPATGVGVAHVSTWAECGLMLIIAVVAFFTARFSQSKLLFLLYGSATSSIFLPGMLRVGHWSWLSYGIWWPIGEACVLVVGMGLACRLAASLQHWLMQRRPRDPRYCRGCGYDLTGNVSGRCPECGHETHPA